MLSDHRWRLSRTSVARPLPDRIEILPFGTPLRNRGGAGLTLNWATASRAAAPAPAPVAALCSELLSAASPAAARVPEPGEIDPLYLFGCRVEWERRSEPGAGWELIAAAQSLHEETRAHARALLASSHPISVRASLPERSYGFDGIRGAFLEASMKTPYGLSIIDTCTDCNCRSTGFFCGLPAEVLKAFDQVSQHSVLPAGAILFVEGQVSRGMFVLCSGKVKLSTSSREGKVLILKTCEAGESLGLSAAISGLNYEMTAETATPCQLNFVDRRSLLKLLEIHPALGVQASQFLSREFQEAYRDIHDLILARSSAGKLARFLLSCPLERNLALNEFRLDAAMTHEEMAQRIGSSRETVTRLITDLKKRQLLRHDGDTLVIRNRPALEALAV